MVGMKKKLEHKAVLRAADIVVRSSNYNDKFNTPGSPYTASFAEAVSWAQLDTTVRNRLVGIRAKDQNSNFL